MITLAGVDELELDEEDEVVELDTDELELRELELDSDELELRELELDRDKLELLLISGADELDKDELDSDEEIDTDDDTEDDVSGDELVVEDWAVDELLTEDEIAIDCDELIADDAALLELDEPLLLPEPQATKVQPRKPMIIGFIEEIIIKLSCVIVMVDYTISAWCLYTSNCKELNCAK
jgi:hypothetical protein